MPRKKKKSKKKKKKTGRKKSKVKKKKKVKKKTKKNKKKKKKKKKKSKKAKKKKRKKAKRKKAKRKKSTRKKTSRPKVKKARPKGTAKSPDVVPEVEGIYLGRVEDFFAQVSVIAFKLDAPLAVGDTIRVKSQSTDFTQTVESIQIEHQAVASAQKGDSIGIKVGERAHQNNRVYKVSS